MNAILNKEQSIQYLLKLGVPKGITQITAYGGGSLHEKLFRLREPYTIYASQDTIPFTRLAVLFEKGRYITAFDMDMEKFIRFDLAFPDKLFSCRKNIQHILAEELTQLIAQGLSKSIFDKISTLLGFEHKELLWEHFNKLRKTYQTDYQTWLEGLVIKIDIQCQKT